MQKVERCQQLTLTVLQFCSLKLFEWQRGRAGAVCEAPHKVHHAWAERLCASDPTCKQ